MFECTTDQFLMFIASADERECDPRSVLEEAVGGLGPRRPLSPRQVEILNDHLLRHTDRRRAGPEGNPRRIPEAA